MRCFVPRSTIVPAVAGLFPPKPELVVNSMKAPEKTTSQSRENLTLKLFYLSFFYLFFMVLTAPILLREIHANDLWKALYSGRYLWIFHQFPSHATFSFSPVLDFLPRNSFNWLGNLVFILLQATAGLLGQQALRVVIVVFAVVVVHSILNFDSHPALLFILVMFTYGLVQKTHLRTAIFSVGFTPVLIWIWYQYYYCQRRQWLYAIPVVMILWSNMHGSYLVGIGLLFLLFAGSFLNRSVDNDAGSDVVKLTLVFGLVVLGVTFVKPYPDYQTYNKFSQLTGRLAASIGLVDGSASQGSTDRSGATHIFGAPGNAESGKTENGPEEPSYVYRTVKSYLQTVFKMEGQFRSAEFAFPYEHTKFLFVRAGFVIAAVGVLSFIFVPFPLRLDLLLVSLGSILLGLGYLRTVAYIPMVLIPVIFIRKKQGDFDDLITKKVVVVTSLVSLLAIWILTGNVLFLGYTNSVTLLTGNPHHNLGIGTVPRFNDRSAEWILANYPNSRFYNSYNVGGFLIWKWWPYKKVFLDSKFSAYDPKFQQQLISQPLPKTLKDHKLDFAVLELTSPWSLNYFLPSPDWALLRQDEALLVFRRNP